MNHLAAPGGPAQGGWINVKLEDWKNGWFGISMGIDSDEIDRLIELLKMIKGDPDEHFHLSSDYKGTGGVGDIEISMRDKSQKHNMHLSSRPLKPGEDIPV